MIEFLQMGGYAAYVWPAYIITAVVMIANVVIARRQLSNRKEQAKRIAQARGSQS